MTGVDFEDASHRKNTSLTSQHLGLQVQGHFFSMSFVVVVVVVLPLANIDKQQVSREKSRFLDRKSVV